MLALFCPQQSFKTPDPCYKSMSIRSLGKELTNSVSSLAGTVMIPSSSTIAPIQVVMAISRFVADSFSMDWSVLISTFWVMGKVDRLATARPTIPSPRLRFSCNQDNFIVGSPDLKMKIGTILV